MKTEDKLVEAAKSDELIVGDLERLVGQPSISARGEGLEECAELLGHILERDGFDVEVSHSKGSAPTILARIGDSRPSRALLLYSHYDVQPPDPMDEWHSDPFKLVERGGVLYGRGVADDKGDIVARLAAVRALRKAYGDLPISLTWVIEGEEEIGSPNLDRFISENRAKLDGFACLWEGGDMSEDGRPNFYLGVKGMLYVEVGVRTAAGDRHSMYAPILPNPAERISRMIAGLRDGRGRIRIKGFYDDVRRPTRGERLLLSQIPMGLRKLKESLGAAELLERNPRKALEGLVFSPTCNVAGLCSGYCGPGSKTIVPAQALLKMDFRLVPDQDPKKILGLLRRHLRSYGEFEVKVHTLCWPARTDPDSPIVRHASEAARAVYGVKPHIWPSMFGTGPMYLFSRLGIPTAMLNCVAHQGSNLHAPNENILVEHLRQSAAHLALTFHNSARGGSGRAS